jgi:REP element-mobilizing transposase RayT
MPNTYWEAYYHFVWSTHERAPAITEELEPHLFRYIRHKCRELGAVVHALNGMPDHIHLAASVPPRLAVSDFIHDVKGSSSRFVNDRHGGHEFHWQEGYAVLTFGKRDLSAVVRYIVRQKEHHRTGKLSPDMEMADE